jgi:hypothetical protein
MTGKKITDRIKDPEQYSKEYTTGIPIDGSVDPTGEYPRRNNWYGSSISRASRGVEINNVWLSGSDLGVNFDVPVAGPSIYPFNQANTTPSGHSFELDDTPGNERILIKHHSGAGVELKSDGSVLLSAISNQVQVVGGSQSVIVSGPGNLTYDGDLNMRVNGNYNLHVGGTFNVDVGANHNHSVHGTQITEVGDVHQTIVRGNKDTKVYGDVLTYSHGEQKSVSRNDIRIMTGKDFITNSNRHQRHTAVEYITSSSGKQTTISSEKVHVTGKYGKVGGDNWHHIGRLFTGPDNDQGTNTVFHGNLIGRALEAWTAKYAINAKQSHSAWRSEWSHNGDATPNAATIAIITAAANPTSSSDIDKDPDYKFKWGWNVEDNTVYEQQTTFLADPNDPESLQGNDGSHKVSPHYGSPDWWEVWNKTSPFAVRKVIIDYDGTIRDKISKIDGYTYYFRWSPTTDEVRSKLRTMDGANDVATSPEMQTDGEKCISTLLDENRICPKYLDGGPSSPYEVKRTGKSKPYDGARFGKTLLGNPVERASKVIKPTNRGATNRTIVADPLYNPDKYDTPITSNTKLSRSATISKFLGAPGSRSSLEMIPLQQDRQNIARQYYLHAWLMDGVASSREFQNYRLQVLEGYYHPAKGIREEGQTSRDYWREPFKKDDGGGCQASIVKGSPYINELKHNGRAVVYRVLNSRGKVDYGAGFEMALYIRDTFFYDQLSLDYDYTRPDFIMSQQLIVVMPEIEADYKAKFEMKTCTYFNRQMFDGGDLVEITD